MSHKITLASDLHGNESQYPKLEAHLQENPPDSLLLGGDLAPKTGCSSIEDFILMQRKFFLERFPQFLRNAKEANPDMNIFAIMGNDDVGVNLDVLQKVDPELAQIIHMTRAQLSDGYEIVGYPYVPPAHVSLADWFKWEMPEDEIPERFAKAQQNKVREQPFGNIRTTMRKRFARKPVFGRERFFLDPRPDDQPFLRDDFRQAVFTRDPGKTVYLMHAPPYRTHLDHAGPGHRGSFAMRMFIEEHQPHVTLHGHLHGTVKRSGQFMDKIGDTVCIATGNTNKTDTIAIVEFDLEDPESAERIIL